MNKNKKVKIIAYIFLSIAVSLGTCFLISHFISIPKDAKIISAYSGGRDRIYAIDDNNTLWGSGRNIGGFRFPLTTNMVKIFDNVSHVGSATLVTQNGDLYAWNTMPRALKKSSKEIDNRPVRIVVNAKKAYTQGNADIPFLFAYIDGQDNLKIRGSGINMDKEVEDLPVLFSNVDDLCLLNDMAFVTKDKKMYFFAWGEQNTPVFVADNVVKITGCTGFGNDYTKGYFVYQDTKGDVYLYNEGKSEKWVSDIKDHTAVEQSLYVLANDNKIMEYRINEGKSITYIFTIEPKVKVTAIYCRTDSSCLLYLGEDNKLYCYGDPEYGIFSGDYRFLNDEPAVFP